MSGHDVGDNNRLLSDGVYDYEYDEEGNRTARELIATGEREEYEWDHRNRLVKITFKDEWGVVVKTVEHEYDHLNRWIRREVDPDGPGGAPAVDSFFAHFDGQITLEFDGPHASDLAHRHLWGPAVDQILADEQVESLLSEGDVIWPLTDHLNTTRDLVERDELTGDVAVASHRQFDSYGELISETNGAVAILFGFTGRPLDDSTGLQNNLHRWHDPIAGRWISEDPIGFAGGDANLYRYARQRVTSATDPDGLETRQQWQDIVLNKAGITRAELRNYNRFTPENKAIMRAIYGYYQSVYAQNPHLEWAGMATMAGKAVWNGLESIATFGPWASASGHALRLANMIEAELMKMNLEIFMDLAWQLEAFQSKGYTELEALNRAGELSDRNLLAWKKIADGIKHGNQGSINDGNDMLLRREQEVILERGYAELQRVKMGHAMGAMTKSPIPGGKPFSTVVPGGNLANFDDRWKWINDDMIPAWRKMSQGVRMDAVMQRRPSLNDFFNPDPRRKTGDDDMYRDLRDRDYRDILDELLREPKK